MSLSEPFLTDDLHPIDIVETLAEGRAWQVDRVGDDRIAMSVEGQWRNYAVTLAWSHADEMLRLICTFDIAPPAHRRDAINDLLNRINDDLWAGAFTWWEDQGLMAFRYGLLLSGGQMAGPDQIDRMIAQAVGAAERFYPALQLAGWGERAPAEAIQIAICEAYGRA